MGINATAPPDSMNARACWEELTSYGVTFEAVIDPLSGAPCLHLQYGCWGWCEGRTEGEDHLTWLRGMVRTVRQYRGR